MCSESLRQENIWQESKSFFFHAASPALHVLLCRLILSILFHHRSWACFELSFKILPWSCFCPMPLYIWEISVGVGKLNFWNLCCSWDWKRDTTSNLDVLFFLGSWKCSDGPNGKVWTNCQGYELCKYMKVFKKTGLWVHELHFEVQLTPDNSNLKLEPHGEMEKVWVIGSLS